MEIKFTPKDIIHLDDILQEARAVSQQLAEVGPSSQKKRNQKEAKAIQRLRNKIEHLVPKEDQNGN